MNIHTDEYRTYTSVPAEKLTAIIVELRALGFNLENFTIGPDGTFSFGARAVQDVEV